MSDEPAPHDLDSLLPPEMAKKAESIGVRKAAMSVGATFTLAVLAGAFIALGAMFSTTVATGGEAWPFGVVRLVSGLVFSLGLVLVIVGGAELFTGNNLIVMAWVSGRISTLRVLRNWGIVYLGNFIGATGTAVLVFLSGQYFLGRGQVGLQALAVAESKLGRTPLDAFLLGVLCNALVCLAVWMSLSARTTIDRVASVVPPVAAFVATGLEHSVANMYFVPLGFFVRDFAPERFWSLAGRAPVEFASSSWGSFLVDNLLPVTLGNIVGGAGLVGLVYWFVYLRPSR